MKTSLIAIGLATAIALVAPPAFASRGGSNFHFYKVDGCQREPYGVLKNYHSARDQIDDVLINMRANGQDRLRLGIFHMRGAVGGTLIDSTGGNIDPQYRQNLVDLLATVRAAGFVEVVFSFFPQAGNNPSNWTSTGQWTSSHEDIFQENWNLIYNLMPILRASGIHYVVDLGNELSPTSGNYAWNQYSKKMWNNYVYVFGNTNTMGFSLRPGAAVASNMRAVYGPTPPHVFGVHLYENAYSTFRSMDLAMDNIGYKVQGWIISEAFYNDAQAASDINRAKGPSARTVHYVTQWPLTSAKTCEHVDVVPENFDNYIRQGF